MVGRTIKIILLLLLVGCSSYTKFDIGDCIKGDLFTFKIVGKILDDYTIINRSNGYISQINTNIADKAFRKVNCEE